MTYLTYLLLIPILFSIAFWIVTTVCVAWFMRTGRQMDTIGHPSGTISSVSLIKPVCGLEKNLRHNLTTACRQAYPDYEVIFAVQSKVDPALAIVDEIKADFQDCRIVVIIDSNEVGANGKVNNIHNAAQRAGGEILVVSDSDMSLESDYLDHIVAPLKDKSIGIVCTLYQAWRPANLLEALELLTYNSDFVPAMLFAYVSRTSIVCPGATLAIRSEVLEEVGGLASLGDYFVEDFELGRRVKAKGYRIALIPYIAKMDMSLTSCADWWRHQVYWDQNTKAVNPGGYFLTLLVRGVPFALLYALLGGPYGVVILVGSMAMRLFTGLLNTRLLRDDDGLKSIWLLPIRDLLGIVVWLVSLIKQEAHWRGKRYRLKKGKMVPVE